MNTDRPKPTHRSWEEAAVASLAVADRARRELLTAAGESTEEGVALTIGRAARTRWLGSEHAPRIEFQIFRRRNWHG